MKWINHKILTSCVILIVTENPWYALYSVPGAVLPDWIEGTPPDGSRYWEWRSKHRGSSHWFLPYLGILLFVYWLKYNGFSFWDYPFLGDFGIFIMLGAIMHILEDAVCGKVPVFSLKKKYGIKLFSVGSIFEYLFCYSLIAGIYYWKFYC